ncbi:phosphate ABC transporter membrane protein 1 (PhoT family) [Nitrosospira sp. Nsp5]|uniref:Phosphate transport system permease protein n=1 Tax=Nitrosospira multiformis TaxID=1231 RepID=A0ABY0T7E9_9PROT|nr:MULTISPECIES: phosphate ABC transporter permease subunit PstC [Nitrosospira]PTR06521.1 phosphate ABC transporter membrane protein 1 (PhoT family) [Nitrosospira sp. Nsp5]SDQ38788.1 phosphate ABC transporter membrane protein 1, PhoT family [Nitrosospira multiformis]
MVWSKHNISSPSASADTVRVDKLILWLLRGGAGIAAALVLLIFLFLAVESWPALRHISAGRFLTDPSWNPGESMYNLAPMLSGTLYTAGGALLVATPLGIASALFIAYYAPPRTAGIYRRLIELLAGIPSVVYGFWGLITLVPLINQLHPPGASLLAGILVLTLMILPTIALTAHAALLGVPGEYLRGAAALGLSRWGMLRGVVLPAAKPGIVAGIMLATGRAIGETMAVLMVTGNVVRHADSLFDPVRTLAANIALEMAYAMNDHRAALFVSGLTLMLMVMMLSGVAGWPARNRHV